MVPYSQDGSNPGQSTGAELRTAARGDNARSPGMGTLWEKVGYQSTSLTWCTKPDFFLVANVPQRRAAAGESTVTVCAHGNLSPARGL